MPSLNAIVLQQNRLVISPIVSLGNHTSTIEQMSPAALQLLDLFVRLSQ